MKTTKIIVVIIFVCLGNILSAQQGKYVRKSVSSLESVWFKPGSVGGLQFDSKTFDKFIDFYIEIERFDYNTLPANLLQEFRREANSIEEVSADALSEVLQNTVTSKIVEILNDPDVMKERGEALKDESAFQSFAATKAKSLGLTTDELKTLMNSAYIYLPFISSAKKESEGADDLSITLEGGIIWWQMKMAGDGSTSVEQVLSATTKGYSVIDPTAKAPITKEPLYNKFKFGTEEWSTTPTQYCQNDAMLAFAKNLGVKTKEIDDFKLQAQIVEADGKKYAFPLGFKEGVHLDDGFHIVEFMEDEQGNEVAEEIGFVRVAKTGDNKSDPNNYTYAKQLLGSKVSEGTTVLEHPRLGMDARAKLGFITGMSIPKEYMLAGSDLLFADDITSGLALDVIIAYNLAPIIGISQTFLDIEMTFALPMGEINPDLSETPDVAPFLFSFYGGGSHKIWLPPSSNVTVGGGFGIESFNLAGTVLGYDYVWSVRSLAFKIGADFERMINADLSWNVGLAYKLALAPSQLAITWGTYEATYEGDDVADLYEDLSLSGLMINAGVNYALGELPINIFGFLDPFKKH
jgi:hypothetical protein